MGAESKIEWTDATWPVVKGCDYVSPGCANCYAADLIHRHAQHPNEKISLPLAGLTEVRNGRARWTGKVYLNEPHLNDPLKWKKRRMIFVPSHGDLFHEDVPDEFIDRVFGVMALAQQHTFQVLTKRAERMRKYLKRVGLESREETVAAQAQWTGKIVWDPRGNDPANYGTVPRSSAAEVANRRVWPGWPLPNVWLGVSVEDQATADERIPHLLKVPTAVRFLSCEPLLGPVNLKLDSVLFGNRGGLGSINGARVMFNGIDWVIVGGESGPGARPMQVEWARSLVQQCKAAGVACFVKQLGAKLKGELKVTPLPMIDRQDCWVLKDAKGSDPEEWPADLRVRQFPTVKAGAA